MTIGKVAASMQQNDSGSFADKPRMAYLTKRFPRLSETFILDEILALERYGLNLRLFSLAHPGETLTQPDVASVKSTVTYLHHPGSKLRKVQNAVLTALSHLQIVRSHPRNYFKVLLYVALKRRSRTTVKHLIEAGRLADLIMKDDTRHIHAAFAHGPASTAHFASLLTGIPFSFSAHAKDLYLSAPDLMARKVAASSFVLVCSASAEREMNRLVAAHHDLGVRERGKNKVFLEYHGVNVDRFTPPSQKSSDSQSESDTTPDRTLQILAVGRLVPKKGYFDLLDALSGANSAGRNFTCRVIGSGPLKDQLLHKIKDLNLEDKVELAGARTHQEIVDEYCNSDIFVQSSIIVQDGDRDGVPNSVLEAMASGMAVVGTDVAGIPEVVIDGETGLVVPQQDPKALAKAIITLLDDSELRTTLGKKARLHTMNVLSRDVCNAAIARRFEAQMRVSPKQAATQAQVLP